MTDLATIAERSTLMFVRHLPGPIDRVWAYLTDPKFLIKWLSDGVVADGAGGVVRFEMGATGRITAYQPPHLLEYTWNEEEASCGPVADALVRWELAEEGDGVRLTLTHSRLPENEVFAHGAGWHAFLQRLSACIDGRDPKPFAELYARCKPYYVTLM
ncbi:MAG: SRPBCC family protein, partial [Candidatus Eremiobacteraeota bacterium]|nr:SRPBCC family protein [Candidatus Eremiobacteraeota bacterium]